MRRAVVEITEEQVVVFLKMILQERLDNFRRDVIHPEDFMEGIKTCEAIVEVIRYLGGHQYNIGKTILDHLNEREAKVPVPSYDELVEKIKQDREDKANTK